MATRLPLFPLGTVLVPGEVLPLHVFEPRYRQLVSDLMAQREAGAKPTFGVVAIRAGLEVGRDRLRALHAIGCVAEVLEVHPHPDGSSDLMSVGRQRFTLLDLDSGAGTPYLTGLVEWCEEPVVAVPPALVARVQQAFDEYCHQLGALVTAATSGTQQPDRLITGSPREDPTMLSYLVTGSMVLHLAERQRLLAAADAGSRLRMALQLLRRELTLLMLVPSVPAVNLAQVPADPR